MQPTSSPFLYSGNMPGNRRDNQTYHNIRDKNRKWFLHAVKPSRLSAQYSPFPLLINLDTRSKIYISLDATIAAPDRGCCFTCALAASHLIHLHLIFFWDHGKNKSSPPFSPKSRHCTCMMQAKIGPAATRSASNPIVILCVHRLDRAAPCLSNTMSETRNTGVAGGCVMFFWGGGGYELVCFCFVYFSLSLSLFSLVHPPALQQDPGTLHRDNSATDDVGALFRGPKTSALERGPETFVTESPEKCHVTRCLRKDSDHSHFFPALVISSSIGPSFLISSATCNSCATNGTG